MTRNLQGILLSRKQTELAEVLGLSSSELSRKINSEHGWKLNELEQALDWVGVTIASNEHSVIIDKDEYEALQTFAKKWLNREDK